MDEIEFLDEISKAIEKGKYFGVEEREKLFEKVIERKFALEEKKAGRF